MSHVCLWKNKKKSMGHIEAFTIKDEIGTCLNIEVHVQVIDKCLFFIRQLDVKGKDKHMIDIEMQKQANASTNTSTDG